MIHLSKVSNNGKTGRIPVSTSSKETCPDSCAMKKEGTCYAAMGPLNLHWQKVTAKLRGIAFKQFFSDIKALPDNQIWRHNQAGDLAGKNENIDSNLLKGLVKANKGKRGFTYTHKKVLGSSAQAKKNRALIEFANKEGFTINLSADSISEADKKAALKIGPVVVVLPINSPKSFLTPKGHKVVVCPAQIRDDITCESCALCQKQRGAIVGFLAHGTNKAKLNKRLSA